MAERRGGGGNSQKCKYLGKEPSRILSKSTLEIYHIKVHTSLIKSTANIASARIKFSRISQKSMSKRVKV